MPRDPRKYLYDIDKAPALVADFTRELTFDVYQHNAMARAAVERQFEAPAAAFALQQRWHPPTTARHHPPVGAQLAARKVAAPPFGFPPPHSRNELCSYRNFKNSNPLCA